MLNHIDIMGRLTRDPELRRTGNGTAVTSFTLAVERDFAQQGEEKPVDFIDCVAWRQTAEFVAKYFTKGRMMAVSGSLQTRSWTDKDGNKRKSVEIIADHVYFADSKREGEQGNLAYNPGVAAAQPSAYTAPAQADDYAELTDEDDGQLPF